MNELIAQIIKEAREKYGIKHEFEKLPTSKDHLQYFKCKNCGIQATDYKDPEAFVRKLEETEECFGWKEKIWKVICRQTDSYHLNAR